MEVTAHCTVDSESDFYRKIIKTLLNTFTDQILPFYTGKKGLKTVHQLFFIK